MADTEGTARNDEGKAQPAQPVQTVSEDELDLEKKFPEFKGYESIGFHRQLGGELWNVVLQFVQAGLIIFMISVVTPLTNPYPEIGGYSGIAGGLFGTIFLLFDVPTNFGVNAFVSENRIKNPAKMFEYIRFVIWWQMFSGLIQITGLSYFTFAVVIQGNYSYLSWLLLFTVQKQWPSMLGIFRGCIDGFQHFDKSNLLGFLQGTVTGQLLNIGFVLLGRWVGMTNPAFGEILAMGLFGSIGGYTNDILFFFISIYYFNKIVKSMGYSSREAWRFQFGRDVVKRSLSYGIQASIIPMVSSFAGLTMLLWYTQQIASYPSWVALVGTGTMMSGVLGNFGGYNLSAGLAEAYPNGMKKLSEFYISYSMRWRLFFMSVFATSLFAVYPFFDAVIRRISGLEYWVPALVFFIPGIFRRMCDPMIWLPDQIFWGTFHIKSWVVSRILEECLKLLTVWLYLFIFKIQNNGIPGITFLIVFEHAVPWTIKSLACLAYANWKICKVKIYWTSSVIIPFIASLPIFLLTWFWTPIFWQLMDSVGVYVTATVSILLAFTVMFFVFFFPLTAILGGWDDYSFFMFKKAVSLSGPSKPLLKFLEREVEACIKISKRLKLHGRWPIPYQEAHAEMEKLTLMKKEGKLVVLKK
ncbi:MAG: hypothetical protein GYA24_03770 [Candidatus Lokiarchaeota archaeon]|nr:hypothetical protein [Candidatus Lokiarchaeota archaeon]